MCGIICLIQYNGKPIDITKAIEATNQLRLRGPDKQSYYQIEVNNNVDIFMGFARLAIMDPTEAGQQPFNDQFGNYVICNGEIYNYKKLINDYKIPLKSNCDCEVILPLFRKTGFEKMIQHELDAEFAMVLYDEQHQRIYAARDRFGVRPLYYGYNNKTKTFGFASELKALNGLMEFVEQVKSNYYFTLDLTKQYDDLSECYSKTEYYSYATLNSIYLNDVEQIHERINNLLTEAVRKRLSADRPIGFLLSGGLDSSLIVAIATKILGPDKIVCFSIGFDSSPDVTAAKQVVEFLNIPQQNHHIVPFDIVTGLAELTNTIRAIETYDITTIRASVPQYIMAKYINANTNIKALLSGEGSDEIHGSYRYFRDAPDKSQFHHETLRLLEELYYFDNQRTDRTMSNNGLEVRVPFLDFAYVEYIKKIDIGLLMYRKDFMEKQIVRDSFKGYLPDEVLYRSKEAFSDAVSNSETNWAASLSRKAAELIPNMNATSKYKINPPKTIDAIFFRTIFDSVYPGRDNVIPHYWLPKFQEQDVLDPSAKVLKCYQN